MARRVTAPLVESLSSGGCYAPPHFRRRPMVGLRTLDPSMLVRIQPPEL